MAIIWPLRVGSTASRSHGGRHVPPQEGSRSAPLTDAERAALTQLSRSQAAPAAQVARARHPPGRRRAATTTRQAARAAGRRSGDAVSHLVARFNAEGLAALTPRHGGGRPPVYDPAARERILAEVERPPTPEADGTATWSL